MELKARPLTKKEVISPIGLAVFADEPVDEPDLSDIFVANDAAAEKIMEQRRQIIEEEQDRSAEELNLSRDTYEGRLQALLRALSR